MNDVLRRGLGHGLWTLCTLLLTAALGCGLASAEEPKAPAPPAPADAKQAEEPLPKWFGGEGKLDPTGNNLGAVITPAADGKGDIPGSLSQKDMFNRASRNWFGINFTWTLICGFIVMFMQAGFALVETGLCRAKNAAHTMAMNFMIYPLACIGFYFYGFALGWGNWNAGPVPEGYAHPLGSAGLANLNSGWGLGWDTAKSAYTYGLFGTKGFMLIGCDDVSILCLFFFMMVFMDTTATIPTGAMAERWAWKNFVLFGLWVSLPYCLYANWVWGGGWLAQAGVNWKLGHGAVDFAGSGVVHAMGGAIALAGAMILGPRIGKFVNGVPQPIPGHHVPMVVLGTFILAFGWFGFNPGSSLSGTDLRNSFTVVNTMLATVSGAFATMCWLMFKGIKPDPTFMCNGLLAGAVAITAPCAFVSPWAAFLIGLIAGVLVVEAVFFWEGRGIDDPVGAISVHGVNGTWGLIATGLFANGDYGLGWNGVPGTVRGAFYGDWSQLVIQFINAGVVLTFGFVMAYVWFKLSDLITPIRVSRETELAGLDIPEMGTRGYDFQIEPKAAPAPATQQIEIAVNETMERNLQHVHDILEQRLNEGLAARGPAADPALEKRLQTAFDKRFADLEKKLAEMPRPVAAVAVAAPAESSEKFKLEGLEKGLDRGLEKGLALGIERGIEKGLQLGLDKGSDNGRLQEARSLLLKLGTRKLGAPDASVVKTIETETSLLRLEDQLVGVLTAKSWPEVLGARV